MNPILFTMIFLPLAVVAQKPSSAIETSDIRNFWAAFDELSSAGPGVDSIEIMQKMYIDRASDQFKKFLRLRNFTAGEYVKLIGRYPAFWKTIRPLTESLDGRKGEIQGVLDEFSEHLPNFRRPDICFAIGGLRTGGTTSKGLILIGAEIAAADSTVDKSELAGWQKNIVGNTGDIVAMVAHEAVHTQQSGFPFPEIFSLLKHKKLNLLNMSITEGSADFITRKFLGLNINSAIYAYGEVRQCALIDEFRNSVKEDPFNYDAWLYNGNQSKDRPADLGYYMGYMISEAFYDQSRDKRAALKTILKRGRYKKVYRESGMEEKNCN